MKKHILSILAVVFIVLGAIWIMQYVNTSKYDRARERIARLNDEPVASAESVAFNLFAFNTDQIHSDQLIFQHNLEPEFAKNYEGFYSPIKFYMQYQGHDWDGKSDDGHSLVFSDGSSATADILRGALRIRYYSGWRFVANHTLVSSDMRELYFMPDGTRLWRNDGRIFCFTNSEGAWLFRHQTAYYCSESEYHDVDIPFDYDEMVRWCGLDNGVITFATYDGIGGTIWLFNNGDCKQLYASPTDSNDPAWFLASNYRTALNDRQIIYDLPDGKIIISASGDIIRGE